MRIQPSHFAYALTLLIGSSAGLAGAQAHAECSLSCALGQVCDEHGACVPVSGRPQPVTHSDAASPDEPLPPDVREHDGLLLRLMLGLTHVAMQQTQQLRRSVDGTARLLQSRTELSGLGTALSLDVGYALTLQLTLHARLSQFVISDPTITRDPRSLEGPRDPTRSVLLLGPALTYFLMPWNAYLTLALGPSLTREARYDGDRSLGDLGVAMELDVGKEWWVGEQWGAGVVLRGCVFASAGDAYPKGEQSGQGYSVALLAVLSYQ